MDNEFDNRPSFSIGATAKEAKLLQVADQSNGEIWLPDDQFKLPLSPDLAKRHLVSPKQHRGQGLEPAAEMVELAKEWLPNYGIDSKNLSYNQLEVWGRLIAYLEDKELKTYQTLRSSSFQLQYKQGPYFHNGKPASTTNVEIDDFHEYAQFIYSKGGKYVLSIESNGIVVVCFKYPFFDDEFIYEMLIGHGNLQPVYTSSQYPIKIAMGPRSITMNTELRLLTAVIDQVKYRQESALNAEFCGITETAVSTTKKWFDPEDVALLDDNMIEAVTQMASIVSNLERSQELIKNYFSS